MLKIVEKMRELAREMLRTKLINEVKAKILDLNNAIKSFKDEDVSINRLIAICEFKKSEVKENDPRKESIIKAENETIENAKKNLETVNKNIEELNAEIVKKMDYITKIESGEVKMDAYELNNVANELIDEHYRGKARIWNAIEKKEVKSQEVAK